jgi:hypothetical protein
VRAQEALALALKRAGDRLGGRLLDLGAPRPRRQPLEQRLAAAEELACRPRGRVERVAWPRRCLGPSGDLVLGQPGSREDLGRY